MKKLLAIALSTTMLTVTITSCKEEVEKQDINLLTMAYSSREAEVLSSVLNSAGFDTNIITTPDYSGYMAEVEKGEYDIATTGWTTVTGNPDYAVMSIFHTNGDYNDNGLSDSELDKHLEVGRSVKIGSDEFIDAYYQVEEILNDNAYIVPLTYDIRSYAFSDDIELGTISTFKSRSMKLEDYSYTSESNRDNEIDPLILSHITINLTSLDPMKANDGTVFNLNTNQYARLLNLGEKDSIETGLAIAYESKDQQNFYFALRDDAYFSNGEKITADDVIFSLERASNKDEAGNRVYSIQGNIDTIKAISNSDIPSDIYDSLKGQADIDKDTTEFIQITTKEPYGQLYNMLTHTSGGIVSKKAVEEVGSDYGTVNNLDSLVVSGPYIITSVDETTNEIKLVRNEYYYDDVNIKNITFKVIPEMATSTNALLSGEIDFIYNVSTEQYPVIEKADNVNLLTYDSNAFKYLQFNMNEGSKASDINFRKAVYNAINPNVFLQIVQENNGGIGASPLSPVLKDTYPTGYERPTANLEKVQEYLTLFNENK